jgi:hypothetical protein
MAPRKAVDAPVIARLEETVTLSGRGKFAAGLLVLHNVLMLAGYIAAAKGVMPEVTIGTVCIAGNVLLGVCILMGRRRSYCVTREPDNPIR